jgi:hypothetical protein
VFRPDLGPWDLRTYGCVIHGVFAFHSGLADSDTGALAEFAADLQQLRKKAGNPLYWELAARAHYSWSTLVDAAAGRKLPSLPVTLACVPLLRR